MIISEPQPYSTPSSHEHSVANLPSLMIRNLDKMAKNWITHVSESPRSDSLFFNKDREKITRANRVSGACITTKAWAQAEFMSYKDAHVQKTLWYERLGYELMTEIQKEIKVILLLIDLNLRKTV